MNNKKTIYVVCLLLLVTVMTIGYALIEGTLNINGSAKITTASWDIYFSKLEVINGHELENDNAKITNKTEVSFNINLNTPGDYYEFNVDVVNNGTLDAMIDSITITPDLSNEPYLSYTVKYLDDSLVEEKDILHAKKARTIKVRVEYKKDIENNELNKNDKTLNLVLSINYIQADATGKEPTAADKLACQYEIGHTFEFPYNGTDVKDGSVQEFEPLCDGIYKIELWGAQGGTSQNIAGGLGGYTSGNINLSTDDLLYIYVGGKGEDGSNLYNKVPKQSFNGGGAGANTVYTLPYSGSSAHVSASGGGATDIRLYVNDTKSWDNFDSLKSRIMVAGGGGGAAFKVGFGGYGGGLIGGTSGDAGGYYGGAKGVTGGSQISGGITSLYSTKGYSLRISEDGKFGCGGNVTTDVHPGGGGGGGYYGGAGGGTGNANIGGSSGGGGSSFISGHDGCLAIDQDLSTDIKNITHKINSHYSDDYIFTNTVMIDGNGYDWSNQIGKYVGQPQPDGTTSTGHVGHGYARITYLGTE